MSINSKKVNNDSNDDSFIFFNVFQIYYQAPICLCTIVRLSNNYFFPFPQVQKYDIIKENKYTTVKIVVVIKSMPIIKDI